MPRLQDRTPGSVRLRLSLGAAVIVAVIAAGTAGYRLIERWDWLDCLYMTVISVTTVGYREVGALSTEGRIFTIVLILAGVTAVLTMGSILMEFMFERAFFRLAVRRKMKTAIANLSNHVIVCGHGRLGRCVVRELAAGKVDFVVIERDLETCADLEDKGVLVVHGDATDESVLQTAGLDRARALVAALSTDPDNLYLTLTAHGLAPELTILVRAEDQANQGKFLRAGASKVVSPYATGASHIAQLLMRPAVLDFVDLVTREGDLELKLEQIEVQADSPYARRTIAEGRVHQTLGRMIVAIKRQAGSTLFDPPPDTVLQPGDVLITIGREPARSAG